MEEIGDAFEFCKNVVTIKRPFQIGTVVYQPVKVQMLILYYNCLDYFLHSKDFEFIYMDTDSLYLGLSCETPGEAIRPERAHEFQAIKEKWFIWDERSRRTPGLFKLQL